MRYLFIGGAGRSGTSMVQDLVCKHPKINGGPEFNFSKSILTLQRGMRSSFYLNRNQSYYTEQSLDDAFREFYDSFFESYRSEAGAYISEKTPDNIDVIEDLLRLYPDSKFVYVYRDGRDVVLSNRKVATRAAGKIDPSHFKLSRLSHRWKAVVDIRRSISESYESRVFDLRYEDLVSEPEKQMRSLQEFLELDSPFDLNGPSSGNTIHVDDVWYTSEQRDQALSGQHVGKWKKGLSLFERIYLQIRMAHHLDIMGYSVPGWALRIHRTFRKPID